MKFRCLLFLKRSKYLYLFLAILQGQAAISQTKITEYVLFAGNKSIPGQTAPPAPGYGVIVGSATTIQSGSLGSNYLINTTGNLTLTGNIISGDKISLANGSNITGKITAANSSASIGNTLTIGSNALIKGNIDVNGNINIGGGTVTGKVTHPLNTTYTGPVPSGGNIIGSPSLPGMPNMPPINNFPPAGNANITNTISITPGSYGNLALTGNKVVTFSGPGIYIFNTIKNSGTSNDFVYDFKNSPSGTIVIYVHGDIDLNKVKASMINGGDAKRIYCETHGNGITSATSNIAFNIANGSSGQASKWLGTIWAPYAAINLGSGTGSTDFTGAMWSGTQVNIAGGGTIVHAPFPVCENQSATDAGPDKPLEFGNQTTLTGSSNTVGATFSWTASKGGVIASSPVSPSIQVSAAGTYILTVQAPNFCPSTDTAIVTGKINNIIGSELESIIKNGNATSPFFSIKDGKILIDVIAKSGQRAAAEIALTSIFGMTGILPNGLSPLTITGYVPISNLPLLNSRPDLFIYCRPFYGPVTHGGVVTSAGDISLKSQLVRAGYGLSGSGVKVGVISDSYNTITSGTSSTNTAAQDISNGDLPSDGVQVLQDASFQRTDEGRGMLQIVHDVAPEADLYFRTGFNTAGDMAQGINELRNAGCDVIVDDITFITEPFLKDGVIANTVNSVVNSGATYFSAAGNFANKSYESAFNAVAAPAGLAGKAHNFGGGDIYQSVTLAPGNYTIVLQWADDIYSLGQTGTINDLDIYLTPNTDGTALFGFNRNNTGGDPIEFVPFTVTTATTTNILIINNNLTSDPGRIKYVVFQGDITINEYNTGTSTIVGQANATGAMTIGAARFDRVPPATPGYTLESFSSIGGTTVNGVLRQKPDFVAPDGVNTTVKLGIDYDGDTYSNFFGTSAAAPHAAAVAALLIEGRKKYLNQLTSSSDIRTLFQNTAHDMGVAGVDNATGYGFIDADAAMRSIGMPSPSLIQLIVPSGITAGTTSFTLTLKGQFFSPTSIAYYRDIALNTTFVNSETVTVAMPTFIGNPAFKVCTPSISSSGNDGGCSNTLYLNSPVKKNVTVTANSFTKKYGQEMPILTASILVDGAPTVLDLASLGLTSLTINTAANSESNVGTYIITPVRVFSSSNSNDVGFLELYNYTFNQGTITIEKLPITITANNINSVYGEKLPNVQFSYQFDATGIPNPSTFLNTIQNEYESSLARDGSNNDILGLVNSTPVAIVNGATVPIVNGTPVGIVNGQYVAIVNGAGVPIVNGASINIVNGVATGINETPLSSNQVNNLSFLITNDALQNTRTLTNQQLINGTYVSGSTSVVDLAQESILDFNTNSAQTYLLQPAAASGAIGIVNKESYTNATAVTITNGAISIVNGAPVSIVNGVVSIVNGASITIVNGATVSIVNGAAVTITNGITVPIVNSQNKNAVIFGSQEIGQGIKPLKPINTITGNGVGHQFIIPGTFNNNNFQITHVAGSLDIIPAPVKITPNTGQTKVFGLVDPVFSHTNNANIPADQFTGTLARANGENVGSYTFNLGTLSAGSNYNLILNGTVAFSITAKTVSITPNGGQSKIYGSPDPVFSFSNDGSIANFSGKLGRITGENVSTYSYTLGNLSAGNNYTLILNPINSFSIKPAGLQVKANDLLISENNQPAFTSTISGLKNGDNNPSISYSLSPLYTGAPGIYVITPGVSSLLYNTNYIISYNTGTMYVNPNSPGTKKLRSSLDCVTQVPNPLPGQFQYLANFIGYNDNATMVYVPLGTENRITGVIGAVFDASGLPTLFQPGSTSFSIPFNGIKITWELTSFDSNHKTSVGSEASSSSKKCNSLTNPNTPSQIIIPSGISMSQHSIYPNPGISKVTLDAGLEIYGDLQVFDVQGRIMKRYKVLERTVSTETLDISGLDKGVYLIRVQTSRGIESLPFIKL